MSRRHLVALLVVTAIGITSGAGWRQMPVVMAEAPQGALPTVMVLATGGTIAGAAATDVQAGYTSGQVGVDQLIAAVPQARKLANLKGEQISNIGSQDMNDAVWVKLAARINELAAQPDVAGIVITHGTDTIEETAYFLNLVVKTTKPVVLTAAMRPATALSADGPLNFFNAVAVAADKAAVNRGVLVVINDWIHGAASLTKTSTTAVQTFLSPQAGLIGTVAYGKAEFNRGPIGKHTTGSEFAVTGTSTLPRVDIIMAYENMDGSLIDAAASAGARGIVIAGVGNGDVTEAAVKALAAQAAKGIICVRASRVAVGRVERNVELDDDKLGFVASLDKNPQKARVLLRLALVKAGRTAAEVQENLPAILRGGRLPQDLLLRRTRSTSGRPDLAGACRVSGPGVLPGCEHRPRRARVARSRASHRPRPRQAPAGGVPGSPRCRRAGPGTGARA